MTKQTYFDEKWLKDTGYDWLDACDNDRTSFKCRLCCKVLKLSNMGLKAIKSHSENAKHRRLALAMGGALKTDASIGRFFGKPTVTHSSETQLPEVGDPSVPVEHCETALVPPCEPSTSSAVGQPLFVNDDLRVRAEIRWVLKSVSSHYSFNSSCDITAVLQQMFPDSEVAKSFHMSDDKARYLAIFGLTPYFQQILADDVKDKQYVLLFDEALNSKAQHKQLDVHIRFWSGPEVNTRYFTSVFMGHATAADLKVQLEECIAKLRKCNIVQIGMDGPTVNWKLFKDIQEDIQHETGKTMLNIGSCGLHTIHGAFRDGVAASTWDIETFLRAAYQLFKDTPARREDYTAVTGSSTFPLKFVAHRWVENVSVIERLIELLPSLKKYVKSVDEKQLSNPGTKSFDTVRSSCSDSLIELRLHFILSIAKRLQPFLKLYQVDKPMLPFLVPDLLQLVKDMLSRFVKRDVLDSLVTCNDVSGFDTKDTDKHNSAVELGFSADRIIRSESFKKKKVSDRNMLGFRTDAKSVLIALCKKLVQKTPMKYPTARSLSCLDPRNMASAPEQCKTMMKRFLLTCVEAKFVPESDCDVIMQQFADFIHTAAKSELENFSVENDRLDTFLQSKMAIRYPTVWLVVEMALLLSHGQATVERGFSINKEMVVENQQEQSLVARRVIKDHILHVKGVTNINITRAMVLAARSARSKYTHYLSQKKEQKEKEKIDKKRKADTEAVRELEDKRKRLKTDISSLLSKSKELYEKCENTGKVTFVTQGNSLRRTADDKEKQLATLDKEIAERLLALKQ